MSPSRKSWNYAVPRPSWLTDGAQIAIAAVIFSITAFAYGAGSLPAALFLAVGFLTTAALLVGLYRQNRAERFAAILSGDPVKKPRTLSASLVRIALRLQNDTDLPQSAGSVAGLPGRDAFVDMVNNDIAGGRATGTLGVMRLVDFDRIAVFDRAAANTTLSHLARRLVIATGPGHVLAQIDRDTFGLWLRAYDLNAAAAEFRALVYIASHEIESDSTALTPTIEAAVATFPDDGADGAQLIGRASAALRKAWTARDGDGRLAKPASAEATREQFFLEQELARAISEDQLTMVFQPVVDIAAGRMIGAEALLRWNHPTLGAVSPSRFIPTVETIGLSETYGLWVLNTACRAARRWQDEGLLGVKVAVNLSARQLLDPELNRKISRTLQRQGLSPAGLELELTETAAMVDADRTVALFAELRAMGVSLAIDDFGTGYSSLSYLKNLPFDKLKIDREFVTDVQNRRENRAICKALIELGRGLGLSVLAEGVETAEEVGALRALGCNIFQGFHFSRPLPSDAMIALAKDPVWATALSLARRRRQSVQAEPVST